MTACSSCAVELPDGARFCFSCGATQAAPTCASCGAQLVAGARFCMDCGAEQDGAVAQTRAAAPAPAVSTAPVSARRVTSVLFGDLVGFTTLAESRDQEEVRELLGRYFDECRRVIERYGGTVEKFIGDAVMAVWGVPTSHEDDAERAVRTGLELVNAVAAMGEDLGEPDLAMRVGIVTGEVAVTVGALQQGMVAGDAVNTAARVQSAAAPGQVWVDETTRLLTSAAITYLDVGSHTLKGKAEPVPLWSVRAVVAAVGGAQRADGLEAPLVGRERELRLVKELFHSSGETGRPALLVMVGEPGIGKSRLAWEFEKYVDGLRTSVRWHSGRCLAYGEGVAFFALAEAVRARLRVAAPDLAGSAEEDQDITGLLEAGLDRYVPDVSEREWLRPRLGVLLGSGAAGTFPREDLYAAWSSFLERVGEGHPVVLVIDDAHHADDGLLQFVEHVLDVARYPCFVVLLTRPGLLEQHPGLATNRRATVSHLHPLGGADMAGLLDGLVAGLPEPARDALVARSEGVPLYAVETVRSLIDRDLVIPRGGQYVLADPERLDLDTVAAPASLQALISARLDALDPEQHLLVSRASVVGDVFSREQIEHLCPDLDVDTVLAALVRLQIIGQLANRFSGEFGQYQFVQSVVRQVAYATLSRRDRRATHLAMARWTEAQRDPAGGSGDLSPIIAQHYLDAIEAVPGEPDVPDLEAHAIAHLERAAERARALGGVSESAGHLLVALEHAHDATTRARLDSAAAWALADAGDNQRALRHAAAAVEAFDALDDPISAGIAAAAQSAALIQAGDTAGALAAVESRYEGLLDVPGADRAVLALARGVVSAHGKLGGIRRDVVERRIQIAEKLDDPAELAGSWTALSIDFSVLGATATARVLMEAAADLVRAHHLPDALARCLTNLNVDYNLSDLDKALDTGREAVEVAERSGIAVWRTYARANLTLTLLLSGRWHEVDELFADAGEAVPADVAFDAGVRSSLHALLGQEVALPWPMDQPPTSDDTAEQGWLEFALALETSTRGRDQEALLHAVRSVDMMNMVSGIWDDMVHPWPVAAELAIALGDRAALEHLLGIVDQAAERTRVPHAMAAHRRRVAGLLARTDDPDRAESLLREAIEMFGSWGARPYHARTQVELGQWLESQGQADEGRELVAAGRAVLVEIEARPWLDVLGLPTSATVPAG